MWNHILVVYEYPNVFFGTLETLSTRTPISANIFFEHIQIFHIKRKSSPRLFNSWTILQYLQILQYLVLSSVQMKHKKTVQMKEYA